MENEDPQKDNPLHIPNDRVEYYLDLYAEAMLTYVHQANNVEEVLDECIAACFFKSEHEQEFLIEHLIVEHKFKKKVTILKKLLRQKKYNQEFIMFEPVLDRLLTLYAIRNNIAHGRIDFYKDEKSRLPYRNRAKTFRQALYLDYDDMKPAAIELKQTEILLMQLEEGIRKWESVKSAQQFVTISSPESSQSNVES